MPRVAISYRRTDIAMAGRIGDQLKTRYGKDNVFIDIEDIPFGIDFRTHIRAVLLQGEVMVALIGANWLGRDAAGKSRIQQEADPVRVEIETALEHKKPIIPVLIDGAKMPGSDELPASFGNFAYLNAAEVSSGHFFGVHMEHLTAAIDQIAEKAGSGDASSSQARLARTSGVPVHHAADQSQLPNWRADAIRYFVAPLIALLAVHYAIVNSLNLNTLYLRLACVAVPLAFGFALFWIGRRGAGPAAVFALALALVSVAGMAVSESLYSGDPMLPQTRFEWLDNLQFAGTIALSFIVGHLAARMARAAVGGALSKPGKPTQ